MNHPALGGTPPLWKPPYERNGSARAVVMFQHTALGEVPLDIAVAGSVKFRCPTSFISPMVMKSCWLSTNPRVFVWSSIFGYLLLKCQQQQQQQQQKQQRQQQMTI